jgi:hypothetical protein
VSGTIRRASSTVSTGGWSASSSRFPITRSARWPSAITSPKNQFGAVLDRGALGSEKGEVSARGATYREGAVLLWGESKKVGGDLSAVSAFAPDAFLDPTT